MTTLELPAVERTADPALDPAQWVCDNCAAANARVRKRCEDCGTTRY
jgi:hypothetical protein